MFRVYKIQNTLTGSVYIGYTSLSVQDRFEKHKQNSSQKRYATHILYKAFQKHGVQTFMCEEIEQLPTKETALQREQHWIAEYKTNRIRHPNNGGYNMTDGGEGGAGYKHSPEELERMSKASSGRKHTEMTKQKISAANKNRIVSEYSRQRASEVHKGKRLSEQHKRALSLRRSFLNKNITEEIRQKLRNNAATARAVKQYTLKGKFLHQYTQVKHAANSVGLSNVSIRNCCQGKWKTAGGFIWKYS